MRELSEMRKDMDRIDEGLKALFLERLEVSREIAHYKKEKGLQIYDRAREEEKLDMLSKDCDDPFRKESVRELFSFIMGISKKLQEQTINRSEDQA